MKTEARKRTAADKTAGMFNLSDPQSLELLKPSIPDACAMAYGKCTCIRLRKGFNVTRALHFSSFQMNLRHE